MSRKSGSRLSGLEHYSFRDYRKLLSRRRWMIATIALTVACLVALIAFRMPSLYQAKATIMVDPGKVPDSYVKPTATIDTHQRLTLLQEQILSTARLGQVIDELHLYDNQKSTARREEIVAHMRKDLVIAPVALASAKEVLAFEISYTSANPMLAARVADRLASLFIEENVKARQQQVMGTVDFFDHELATAKQDLSQKAQNLAAIRAKYFAELPESQTWRTQALTSLQMELRSEMDAVNAAQQQKVYLQSVLADSPNVVNLDAATANTAGLDEQLEQLQQEMDQLRTRYGPSHPDVLAKSAEIEEVQRKIKESEAAHPVERPSMSANQKHRNPVVESQIAQIEAEIKDHQEREAKLQSQIAYHQTILEKAPAAEQELTAATNEYAEAEDHFKRLEDHKFAADISSDVETRQKGERFVMLEPAQAPEHPVSPNRPLIDLFGLVAGLGLGVLLVLILEILDDTIKTSSELDDFVNKPIFGEIPWISPPVKDRSRVWAALAATANLALASVYAGLLSLAMR